MESPWGECDEAQAELFAEQILLQRGPTQPEQITSLLNILHFRKVDETSTELALVVLQLVRQGVEHSAR